MAATDPTTHWAELALLSLDEASRACRVSEHWVIERVRGGLIDMAGDDPRDWRFDAVALQRMRRMCRVEHDFDAVPELAALVADLLDTIDALKARR